MEKIIIKESELYKIIENSIREILDTKPKQNMTILWLDDIREPNLYFKKEKTSGAWIRNNEYYTNNIFNNYNVNFIWVKNLKEFKNYIINNKMPDMISFDHDLKPKGYVGNFENGADCARWLVNYCKENNLNVPKCYAHTANKSKIPIFNDIFNSAQ